MGDSSAMQDLSDMGFTYQRLCCKVLSSCKGDVKATVRRLVWLERRGMQCGTALSYSDLKCLKTGTISGDTMERLMEIDVAELKTKSAAAERLLNWLLALVLKDPPSPQKAGMLVHTLACVS